VDPLRRASAGGGAAAVGVRLERTVAVAGYGINGREVRRHLPSARQKSPQRYARGAQCHVEHAADLSRLLRMWADDDSGFSAAGVSVHGGKPFALMR
jgi:hypothetical protein